MSAVEPRVKRKPLPLPASIVLHSLPERDLNIISDDPHQACSWQPTRSSSSSVQAGANEGPSPRSPEIHCDIGDEIAVDLRGWDLGAEELGYDELPAGSSVAAAPEPTAEVPASVCSVEADSNTILPDGSDEFELTGIGQRGSRTFEGTTRSRRDTVSPPVELDKSLLSRNICIGCLFLSWCTAIACMTFGTCITPSWNDPGWMEDYEPWGRRNAPGYRIKPSAWSWWCAIHLIPLAMNVLVTICTDSLGFIQTASLRWSLQQDGLLDFNSNLRLLTATKRNPAHRWYVNLISAFFTSSAYAATPLLSSWGSFRDGEFGVIGNGKPYWIPQGIIFIYLGLAIMGQATLATWCLLLNLKSIPTWSSNPINTTLACLKGDRKRQSERCMMSVHCCNQSATTKYPQLQQASASKANQSVARIVRWLWTLTAIALFWGIAMVIGVAFVNDHTKSHLADLGYGDYGDASVRHGVAYLWRGHGLSFGLDPPVFPNFRDNARNTLHICILMLVQSPLVFGLHCLEILVNVSRDEALWRRATSKHGVKHEYNSISAALRSPQTILLFAGKAAAHWTIGQSFNISESHFITVRTAPVFVLTALLALLAQFGTWLANDRPRGPQPAAYGHLQTLADLIDDWRGTKYWGDKGVVPGLDIRHAGTLHRRLKPPLTGAKYGGNCCSARRDAYNEL